VLSVLFPKSCPTCDFTLISNSRERHSSPLCRICLAELERSEGVWSIKSLPKGLRVVRYPYASFYKKTIQQAKFEPNIKLLYLLADKMSEGLNCFSDTEWDFITPIPPTEANARRRLLNQCLVLCRSLKSSSLPNVSIGNFIHKDKQLKSQVGSSRSTRVKNIKRGLSLKPRANISGKSFLLIDDVVTTGSTLAEATELLLKNGASRVDQLVIAEA
jgi:competence protein ComFC